MKTEYSYKRPLKHITASETGVRSDSGKTITNKGATGSVKYSLPQDAEEGDFYHFVVYAAQQLQVDAGAAGAIYIGGAKGADDGYIWADDEAESVTLTAIGDGDWLASGATGTWTAV